MRVELVIRFVGVGLRCNSCGKNRETTRYQIRDSRTEKLMEEFLLCDSCQDKGYIVNFKTNITSPADQLRARRIDRSRAMESDVAKDLGGKRTPGSGNQDEKGDVRIMGQWRLEHKFTDSVRGYRLRVKDLAAIIAHANKAGEWPGMVIAFPKLKRKWVTIPYEVFQNMIERLNEG